MKARKRALSAITAVTAALALTLTGAVGTAPALSYEVSAAQIQSSGVRFQNDKLSLGIGESLQLRPVVAKGDSIRKWVSSDSSVVFVKDGKLKARKTGEAVITVRTVKKLSASCRVRVYAAPKSVTLSDTHITIGVGESYKLGYTIPEGTFSTTRKFISTDSSIASCTASGMIKGIKPGKTKIRLRLHNGITAVCVVKVLAAPSSVKLNKTSVKVGAGESFKLKCTLPDNTASKKRSFTSSNASVASVASDGTVKALKAGTASIKVKLYNGVYASCKVTVKNAPKSAVIDPSSMPMYVGDTVKLYCELPENTASSVKSFSSSDPSVVSCTKDGRVKALRPGSATVIVKLYNGVGASCRITVIKKEPEPEPVKYTYIDQDLTVLEPGQSVKAAFIQNAVSWSSGDSSVARVSSDGVITAVQPGTADITVKTGSGSTVRIAVIVYGDKSSSYFPDINEIDGLLNSEPLEPSIKTGCKDLDNLVDSIFSKILKSNMTKAQKVRACYDYLASNFVYGTNYGYPDLSGCNYLSDSEYFIVTEAYSFLLSGSGTCESFASALTVMLKRLGYRAEVVYGLVGLRAGGKGGHYWTDVSLGGKHFVFDAQVENNNLGYNKYVNHYWYGMRPEYNFRSYEYSSFVHTYDFMKY